jgi:2-polyprenyl-3-methyl-5-hydroxy-6-metoxy-1,4-benzoquinol methylase
MSDNTNFWNEWNETGGPKYPHEKTIQFVFRNLPRETEKRKNLHVLDLGCGGGVHTAFLLQEGFKVSAVDIAESGIKHTLAKVTSINKKCEFIGIASIHDIAFEPETFDAVVCIGVLDSAGETISARAIQKVFAILKKGGKGFFVFSHFEDYRVSLLAENGFRGYSETEVKQLFNHPWEKLYIDDYITTYENRSRKQHDFLVTVDK